MHWTLRGDEPMDHWMNGWMDGWMEGWMDGWMDCQLSLCREEWLCYSVYS